jgi:hypothetical protein
VPANRGSRHCLAGIALRQVVEDGRAVGRSEAGKGRKSVFSDGVLTLFAQLDAVPLRDRETDAFKAKDRELARLLGLSGPWLCDVASVTDGRPILAAGMTEPTLQGHLRVRAVREQLLQALAEESAI